MSVDVAEHGPAAHAIRVCCRVAKAQAKNVCVRVRDPQAAGRVPERTVGPGSGDWRRGVARLTGQLMKWMSTMEAETGEASAQPHRRCARGGVDNRGRKNVQPR